MEFFHGHADYDSIAWGKIDVDNDHIPDTVIQTTLLQGSRNYRNSVDLRFICSSPQAGRDCADISFTSPTRISFSKDGDGDTIEIRRNPPVLPSLSGTILLRHHGKLLVYAIEQIPRSHTAAWARRHAGGGMVIEDIPKFRDTGWDLFELSVPERAIRLLCQYRSKAIVRRRK